MSILAAGRGRTASTAVTPLDFAYGIWPAAGPLIVVGAAAAYEAGREKPARAGFAVAAVVLGASACFAGPAAVWGVIAVGLCALLLIAAAAQLWQRRA